MKKYLFVEHTMMHLVLFLRDAEGNVVMGKPNPEEVTAAIKTNLEHEQRIKRAAPAGSKPAKVAPLVVVPKPEPMVAREVMLCTGDEYELPEQDPKVKEFVELGYLVAVKEPEPVIVVPAPVVPEVKKAEKKEKVVAAPPVAETGV